MPGQTADIVARLRLNGEEFTREFRGRMGDIETQARSTSTRVGAAFSTALNPAVFQRQVEEANRLTAAINPAFAAQQRYNQGLARAIELNAAGALTGQRYIQVLDALALEMRQQVVLTDMLGRTQGRGGMVAAQASQQFQDFFIQVGGGQNVIAAASMQMSQLAFVMQGAGGAAGRFGAIISGPVGAAVILLGMGLGMLTRQHDEAQRAAREHETAEQTLERALRGERDAVQKLTEAMAERNRQARQSIELDFERAEAARAVASQHLAAAEAERQGLQVRLETARAEQRAAAARLATADTRSPAAAATLAAANRRVAELETQIATNEQRLRDIQRRQADLTIQEQRRRSTPEGRINEDFDRRQQILENQFRWGMWTTQQLAEQERQLTEARRRALESVRDQRRGADGDATQFRLPVTGPVRGRFGENRRGRTHAGTDIAVPVGTQVGAAAAGVVIEVGNLPGYGNVVIIDHGRGTTTRYAHLSQMLVQRGQRVDQGEAIALSGGARGAPGAGNSQGPHVHFEVRRSGRAVAFGQGRFPTDEMGGQRAAEELARQAERELEARDNIVAAMHQQIEEAMRSVRVAGLQSQGLERQAEQEEALARVRTEHAREMAQLAPQFREGQGRVTEGLQDQLRLFEQQTQAYSRLRTAHADREKLTDEERAAEEAALAAMAQSLRSAEALTHTLADGLAIREASVRAEQAIGNAIEDANEGAEARAEIYRKEDEMRRDAERQIEEMQQDHLRRQEDQILALADLYETAMRDGVGGLWDEFEDAGIRAIAHVAAQWTLAMMTGQRFDLGQSLYGLGSSGGAGPFGSLLSGLFGGNKGGGKGVPGFGGGSFGVGDPGMLVDLFGGTAKGAGAGGLSGILGAASSAMPYVAAAAAAFSLLDSLGVFKSTKRGSATAGFSGGELGVGPTRGNSRDFIAASSGAMESVIASVNRIAEALGGTVTGAGSLSIGQREGNWRLDPTGRGITKTKRGAIDFGEDQEALVRAGVAELLRDGVVGGISDASKRLLQGGDLEKAIEKAALIEEIPKLLKAKLDPVGAALDDFDARWRKVIAALEEGGATAEQFADAHRLWKLEMDEVIARTASASQGLKDFMDSLRMGPDSPYSLRQQEELATAALQPFLDKIAGGEAIDQERYQAAAQQFLDIERQLYGSTGRFFEAMDSVMAATSKAIERIDSAVPIRTAADPFIERTATNTTAIAEMLDQQNGILLQIREALGGGGAAGGGGFVGGGRGFSSVGLAMSA